VNSVRVPLAPHPDHARLVATLRDALPRARRWSGACYRAAAPQWSRSHDLFSGEGARRIGGRWNPPGIRAAYVALSPEAALAEQLAQGRRAGIPDAHALPSVVSWGDARLSRVLALSDRALVRQLETTLRALLASDWPRENAAGREALPQAIGRAARESGWEALLVPSAAVRGAENLVVFPDRLVLGSRCTPHGLR
jgi:RES domain-containing protein